MEVNHLATDQTPTQAFIIWGKPRAQREVYLNFMNSCKCPILLISGKDDRMWPSWIYGEIIMQYFNEINSPIFRKHLSYEGVGHMITNPYDPVLTEAFRHPVTGLLYEIGGNPQKQASACKDSWEKILLFLSKTSN